MNTNNLRVITAILLIVNGLVSAQNKKLDSLQNAFNIAANDSIKFNILNSIFYSYINTDTAKANEYCKKVLKEAESTKILFEKAEAYRITGIHFGNIAEFDKAIDYYRKAESLYKSLNSDNGNIGYAKTLTNLGAFYQRNGDLETAMEFYLEAESILLKYNDNNILLKVYNGLTDIHLYLNKNEKALLYMDKAKSLSNLIDDPAVKTEYLISYGNNLTYQNKFDEAAKIYQQAGQIAGKNNLYRLLCVYAYDYAFMLTRQERYEEAEPYYVKSVEYARKSGSKFDEYDSMYKVGATNYHMKKFEKANKILLETLKHAEEIKSNLLIRNILDILVYLEEERGNYKLAYTYLQRYVDTIYEIFSEDDQKQTNFLNAKYQAAQREHEITKLLDEQKIKNLELEKQNTLILLLTILVISFFILLFYVRKSYKNKRKIAEQKIQIHKQKVTELEKEKQLVAVQSALEGEENERFRIARDLHDGLGGLLSGTKLALNSYKETYVPAEERASAFKQALNLLDTSITELRRVARNMMPQALLNYGLKEAISEFCDSIDTKGRLKIKYQFFGFEKRIQQNIELTIYRIFQELVNNIIKHSKATEAVVQFIQEEERISLLVQDNGKGFNKSKIDSFTGHGIKNIKTRVESLGGHFEIDSEPGNGTEITIEFDNIKL